MVKDVPDKSRNANADRNIVAKTIHIGRSNTDTNAVVTIYVERAINIATANPIASGLASKTFMYSAPTRWPVLAKRKVAAR